MSENTPNRYHPALVTIHWLMALLVIMMLGVGKFMMPTVPVEDPQKPMMLQTHAYIGIAIAVLLIIRLVLRFTTKRPAPADAGNAFLNWVAKATHFLLYAFMLGMVASGMGLFQLADLPSIFSGATPYPVDYFSSFAPRGGHGLFSGLLLLLVLLHFGAAMYHQFIKKDGLLGRMWFGK